MISGWPAYFTVAEAAVEFRHEEQVVMCFRQIRRWQEIIESGLCVHAMRTKAEPITSTDAARLAHQRFKALRQRQRIARHGVHRGAA